MLKDQGVDVLLCDTTDTFMKRDSTAVSAIEIARCNGLDSGFPPLVMLDGLKGNHNFITDTENANTKAYLGGEIENLNGLIVISEPDTSDDSFLSNPAKIFYLYNRDFKYRYVGETVINNRKMHEIDLYPRNLDQPYSSFKIFTDKEKDIIASIKIRSKDGIDYIVYVKDYITDKNPDDSIFTFDESKHKKVEIIDLRDY